MLRTPALSAWRVLSAASQKAATTTVATTTVTTTVRGTPSLSRALATFKQTAEEQAVKWRFPADDRIQGMLAKVEQGLRQSSVITLNSKAPVGPALIEEAIIHLYNKIESLRLCLRPRQGQLWFADMPRRTLDFQEVTGTDLEEECVTLIRSPFNLHEGPLWKTRLMQCLADAPCAVPEVKTVFPHQCHLLMSLHYAVHDGTVILMVMGALLRIIDSLLEGVPVDTTPIGKLRDGVEAREEENRIREALKRDPERLLAALRKHSASKRLPLLMEAYGVPNEAVPTTKYLPPVLLDTLVVNRLAAKCRSVGATLNTCFTAAFNVATVEVAREAGVEREFYDLSSRHPVDCRRLMANCTSLPLGFHTMPLTQCTSTPRDAKKTFWQYVRHLDTDFREKLKRNYMCEQRVLEVLLRPEGFTHEEGFADRRLPDCDYFFANLYSPRFSKVQNVGKNVQMSWARNYASIHNDGNAYVQSLYTFRGQACLQVAYPTAALSGRVASRCFEKTVAVLHDVSKMID